MVVTGPTGSGKSTTLAAMIDEINKTRTDHIVTIEDPIEFLHRHKKLHRQPARDRAGRDGFGDALRAALRQDPDVILLGEMRDLETIATALTAAETGHLVFATVHTQDAPSAVDRLIDVFPAAQQGQIRVQVAATLQGVVTQNLLPTADGRARVPACEILIPDDAIRNLIRQGKIEQVYSVMQTGSGKGMQTMEQSLVDLVLRGLVTQDMALSRSSRPQQLLELIQRGRGRARSSRRLQARLRTAGRKEAGGTRDRWTQDRRLAAGGRACRLNGSARLAAGRDGAARARASSRPARCATRTRSGAALKLFFKEHNLPTARRPRRCRQQPRRRSHDRGRRHRGSEAARERGALPRPGGAADPAARGGPRLPGSLGVDRPGRARRCAACSSSSPTAISSTATRRRASRRGSGSSASTSRPSRSCAR